MYAQACSRKERQARGPKIPSAPTLPHPCRRRCAANAQWGPRAVLLQAGPPPASLQAEPAGMDGLIQRTQSPAFWYPGKAVFNVPHLAGCVIYSHLYAERSRPKSLLHFHSFNRPQAQRHVNAHVHSYAHPSHSHTFSDLHRCCEPPPVRRGTVQVDEGFWLSSLTSAAQGVGTSCMLLLSPCQMHAAPWR